MSNIATVQKKITDGHYGSFESAKRGIGHARLTERGKRQAIEFAQQHFGIGEEPLVGLDPNAAALNGTDEEEGAEGTLEDEEYEEEGETEGAEGEAASNGVPAHDDGGLRLVGILVDNAVKESRTLPRLLERLEEVCKAGRRSLKGRG